MMWQPTTTSMRIHFPQALVSHHEVCISILAILIDCSDIILQVDLYHNG